MSYYYAYGSNLNLSQMRRRCPNAERVGTCTLPDWQLEFRGVATLVPVAGAKAPGAIYRLGDGDLERLDRYEGERYYKDEFVAEIGGQPERVMVYLMSAGEPAAPSPAYYGAIRQGYADWRLPVRALEAALKRAPKYVPPEPVEIAVPRYVHPRNGLRPYQRELFGGR